MKVKRKEEMNNVWGKEEQRERKKEAVEVCHSCRNSESQYSENRKDNLEGRTT